MFVLLLPIKPLRNWEGGSLLIFLKIILQIILWSLTQSLTYLKFWTYHMKNCSKGKWFSLVQLIQTKGMIYVKVLKISIQQIKIQIHSEFLLCWRHYYVKRYCTGKRNQYQSVKNARENILNEVCHSIESSQLWTTVKRNTDSWPSLPHRPFEEFYDCEQERKDQNEKSVLPKNLFEVSK